MERLSFGEETWYAYATEEKGVYGVILMLLEFVKENQIEEFKRIFRENERKMYAVALHILHNQYDAEDAVYESFHKIILHFEKIILLSCTEMERYIVIIVRNTAINMLRHRCKETPTDTWEYPPAPEDVESETGYGYLVELIRTMPEHYRAVLELALVLEWRIKDIAQKLKLNENTVSARLSRGRKLLQEKLAEEGYFDERAGV